MAALELARAGQLTEALTSLQQEIRQQPTQAKLRVFLFQLLAVLGQHERALNQLKVAGELDPAALPMVQTYTEALRCELLRQDVFAGRRTPLVLGQPREWLARLVEALRLDHDGAPAQAQQLRAEAMDAADAVPGEIDGVPFAWLADADPRLGPVIEALLNGRYYWVPCEHIAQIDIEAPADLRDTVWMPAEFTWRNGGQALGLIPARYPGTVQTGDPQLLLARRTDWQGDDERGWTGLGQRMFATDVGEYPLLAVRSIRFDAPSEVASG
jgi:type VI secretion system protein ImpE